MPLLPLLQGSGLIPDWGRPGSLSRRPHLPARCEMCYGSSVDLRPAGEALLELGLLLITNPVTAEAEQQLHSCAPISEIAPEGPTRGSRLLAASRKVINKNSQRRRWGGGSEEGGHSLAEKTAEGSVPHPGTAANLQPLGWAWPDLTERVSSFPLGSSLGSRGAGGARGEAVVRQAWATRASIHIAGNTACGSKLGTPGRYGNGPPLPIILWSKNPARFPKPHQ